MALNIKGKTGGSLPSWAKRGAAAKQELQKEQAASDQRAEQNKKMFRFFMAAEEEGVSITFLDGDLIKGGDEDGMLEYVQYREHTMQHGPRDWRDYVCIADIEPCPLCLGGDDPSVVGVFTVLAHKPYTSPKNHKTYVDQKKLFVAKRRTLRQLQKAATKRGGLRGWTVEIDRSDKKVARVGDSFDFQQHRTLEELLAAYPQSKANEVTDYEKELPFFTAVQLAELGFGPAPSGGASGQPDDQLPTDDKIDY